MPGPLLSPLSLSLFLPQRRVGAPLSSFFFLLMAIQWLANDVSSMARESLDGLLLSRPDLTRVPGAPNCIVRRLVPTAHVALVCGGGSGHEPAHAGFVGDGWLTAAVCGDVFASPSHKSIVATLRHILSLQRAQLLTTSPASQVPGVLVLIKNYGGDVINFSYAAEVVNAEWNTPVVATHIVGDDVAFGACHSGRRGLAGTVLAYKVLGAAAAERVPLGPLQRVASQLSDRLWTLGASLSPCNVPGNAAKPDDWVQQGQFELGMGIHGEAGKETLALPPVDALCDRMTGDIIAAATQQLENLSPTSPLSGGGLLSFMVLLVNNLGALCDIEVQLCTSAAIRNLRRKDIVVERVIVSRCMTSLSVRGFSLTLLALGAPSADRDKCLRWLDATPVNPSFVVVSPPPWSSVAPDEPAPARNRWASPDSGTIDLSRLVGIVRAVASALKQSSVVDGLNNSDAVVGDGDTGSGLRRACEATLHFLDDASPSAAPGPLQGHVRPFLTELGEVIADAFAGTSGPLLGACLCSAAAAIPEDLSRVTSSDLARALQSGTSSIQRIGGAVAGDRTMVDVLLPLVDAAAASSQGRGDDNGTDLKPWFARLAGIAKGAADDAIHLHARKGRARYQGGREVGHRDPGCDLIVELLTAIAASL